MANKLATATGVLCLSLLLPACQSIEPGSLGRDWTTKLRELNIHPVFPPREDFQVGDVYLLPSSPVIEDAVKSRTYLPVGTWVNTLSLIPALERHYKTRPDFPATTTITQNGTIEQQPTSDDNRLFSHGKLNRLKMVAFPAFFTAEMNSFDAATLIPTSALSGLGLSSNNIKKASVTITSAESYGIPVALLNNAQKPIFQGKDLCINNITGMDANSLELIVDSSGEANGIKKAYLLIVTEVFYARTLKVFLHTDKKLGVGNDGSTTTREAPNLVNKIKAGSGQTPGVSFNFSSSASGNASIDQTFERPVAVGYRGIRREVLFDKLPQGNSKCQMLVTNPVPADDIIAPASMPPEMLPTK